MKPGRSDVELRQLRAFLAVADELHFGRAAERLHIGQSPLSQTIRALERELGTDLFVRTTRSVQLTAAGEALVTPARIIEAQIAVVREIASAASTGETGRVTVGFGGTGGYTVLSALTRSLADSHPGIELELRPQMYSGEVLDALRRGALDMGIVGLPIPRGFETHTVREETWMVAVPARHHLSTRDSVSPEDLATERFVMYPAEHGSVVRDATLSVCATAGFTPTIAHEAPDPYSLLAMVGAGVGIAVVVESTAHLSMDGVVYLPIAGATPTLKIAMAWRPNNPTPAVHTVTRVLREQP